MPTSSLTTPQPGSRSWLLVAVTLLGACAGAPPPMDNALSHGVQRSYNALTGRETLRWGDQETEVRFSVKENMVNGTIQVAMDAVLGCQANHCTSTPSPNSREQTLTVKESGQVQQVDCRRQSASLLSCTAPKWALNHTSDAFDDGTWNLARSTSNWRLVRTLPHPAARKSSTSSHDLVPADSARPLARVTVTRHNDGTGTGAVSLRRDLTPQERQEANAILATLVSYALMP